MQGVLIWRHERQNVNVSISSFEVFLEQLLKLKPIILGTKNNDCNNTHLNVFSSKLIMNKKLL